MELLPSEKRLLFILIFNLLKYFCYCFFFVNEIFFFNSRHNLCYKLLNLCELVSEPEVMKKRTVISDGLFSASLGKNSIHFCTKKKHSFHETLLHKNICN